MLSYQVFLKVLIIGLQSGSVHAVPAAMQMRIYNPYFKELLRITLKAIIKQLFSNVKSFLYQT